MVTDGSLKGPGFEPGQVDIVFERHDGVALATFNRPESLNSFRSSSRDQMREIFADVRSDDGVKALVLTGEGRAFSSGQDLNELSDMFDSDGAPRDSLSSVEELQDLSRQLLDLGKPVIAAINGIAVGFGVELALACDLRVASSEARLGFVEAQRALFPTNGVMYLLPRLVGYGQAMELLLTGDLVPADEAGRIGLVNRVVEPDQLLPTAMTLAGRIANNAPISVKLIKDILSRTYDVDLQEMMRLEVEAMLTCFDSRDLREGVDAFLEKREPSYRGV